LTVVLTKTMNVQTTKLQEGDTLVNNSGSVTIDIDEINGRMASVTDSRDYISDSDEYQLSELQQAIDDGDYVVVRDSDLTQIKGIGESTAPEIEVRTGCETPDELVEAYLTEEESGIHDTIRRTDYLNEWILDNLEELDVDVSLAQMKVMLFVNEFNCDSTHSDIDLDAFRSVKHNTIDGDKLTVEHLEWSDDAFWAGSSSVAGVGRTLDAIEEIVPYVLDDHGPPVAHERDGNHHCFEGRDGETWVNGDYLDTLQEIFTFNLSDVNVHPEGEYHVYVEDEDTELVAMIAPRIR